MTQTPVTSGHPRTSTSRPATPRASSESYTAHLRNISRQSLEAELLHIPPASLSPPSTPRPASPAHYHPGPHHAAVYEPYRPTPGMIARPASQPPSERPSGRSTPRSALSPPASRPLTPRSVTPAGTPPIIDMEEKPPVGISPSDPHPPPRRSYQPDPFEHRTRWSKKRPKKPKPKPESGYCCGVCDEPPAALATVGAWLTGTMTMIMAGMSMACCAAALRG